MSQDKQDVAIGFAIERTHNVNSSENGDIVATSKGKKFIYFYLFN